MSSPEWQSRIIQEIFGSSKKSKNVVKMTVFWLFLKNGSNDFLKTLHGVRYQKSKKSDTAGFLKKIPVNT